MSETRAQLRFGFFQVGFHPSGLQAGKMGFNATLLCKVQHAHMDCVACCVLSCKQVNLDAALRLDV